jgi:hypothetical protein
MKKLLVAVVFVTALFAAQNANGQKDCNSKQYNSVGTAVRENTPYTAIVQNAQENYGYEISFDAWDFEQGSVYCDAKFTNLDGKEEKWNGTGDFDTIKAKSGTTIYARFWNSTNIQVVLITYKVCKVHL